MGLSCRQAAQGGHGNAIGSRKRQRVAETEMSAATVRAWMSRMIGPGGKTENLENLTITQP